MVISYPIPAFQNLPINTNFYKPKRFVISAISLGTTTVITTTVDHDYVIGQEVRLIIPDTNGSRQLNEAKGFVIEIPAVNQVELNIDSLRNVDPFITSSDPQEPQILSIGDVNTGPQNSKGNRKNITSIPGSFINIS